jgi:protein O-mannosyl-transferase
VNHVTDGIDGATSPAIARFAGLGLVAAVIAVYAAGITGGFAFDDFPNIVDNIALRVNSLDPDQWLGAIFSSPSSTLRRPLAMATFAANQYFTGLSPEAMKVTNIALHAMNALLVAGLVRALLRWTQASGHDVSRLRTTTWWTATTWALHPINAMAVLLIVQRMESLAHTFVFAGLWLYVEGRRRQLKGRGGVLPMLCGLLGGTMLGLLSKESAVLLPLYAFSAELCIGRFHTAHGAVDRRLHTMFAIVLFLPAMAALALLLPPVLRPGAFDFRSFTLGERLLTEGRVLLDYIGWTLAPSPQTLGLYHDDYQVSHGWFDPPSTALAWICVAALIGTALVLRRQHPLASLGMLWFFGAHVLTSSFIPLELVYEHRNYFASLGLCLLLADVLLLMPKTPPIQRLTAILTIAFLAWCAITTQTRARQWSDPVGFARGEAARHPASPRATYGAAQLLTIASRYDPASPYLQPARDAMAHAATVEGSGILPLSGLMLIAGNTGQPQDPAWWAEMNRRLRSNPVGPQETGALQTLNRCALAGRCKFPPGALIAAYETGLQRSRHPNLLTLYGSLLWAEGRYAETEALYREAVQRDPSVAQYRINLTKFLVARGRGQEAREQITLLRAADITGANSAAIKALEAALP